MSLQYEIDAETFGTLEESQQGLYEQDGDNYRLSVEGIPEPDNSGLKKKVDELLAEKKQAQAKAKELEQAQKKADEERQKEQGQFRELYEKTQSELEAERKQAREFREQVQSKDLEAAAFKLAATLTKDTARASILAKEAKQFAQHTENGVQFEVGGVPVEPDKLAEKFRADYPFLVDGSGASGSGAAEAGGGAKSLKRSAMSAEDMQAYIAEHGQSAYLKLPK